MSEPGRSGSRHGRLVVASDLDGTLLDSSGGVSPRTVAAVARLRETGAVFVAVTARPLRDAVAIARLVSADLLVCGGGGVLAAPVTGAVTSSIRFPPGAAEHVVAAVRAAVPGARLGIDDGERCVLDPGFDMGTPGSADTKDGRPVAPGSRSVAKVIVQSPAVHSDTVARHLRELLRDGPVVSVSCPAFAEILPAGVHKGTHLQRLFPAGSVTGVAFGDMPGDLPLLDWADTAVAMAHAHPVLLARCDRVTESNDQDGVAVVLEQLLAAGLTRTGCAP